MQDILTIEKEPLLSERTGGFYTGNRIPAQYFETTGTGESDIAIHAGSYHLALKAAHIEMCNIMTYSSILPEIATRIDLPDRITHGAVLERRLKASLEELYREGYSDHYLLGDPRILSESFIPRKAYGTALTALCFTSYYHPIIKKPQDDQLW